MTQLSVPDVYVFVHPAYTDQICYPQTLNVWETFSRMGAIVLYGDDFDRVEPKPADRVVGYGRFDEHRVALSRFKRENRWHYVVDESNSSSGPYQKAMSYMKLLDVPNVIVTYQNAGHLQVLRDHGIRYAIMPQTMPAIRPKITKDVGLLLSGQVSDGFYPVRTRVWNAVVKGGLTNDLYMELQTPGQDISTRHHDTIRNSYYELLDRCKMGVVCRAGHRDRFVAKYIEMGACHVLPVGDCPTYMPLAMKQAMVDVSQMNDADACNEVKRLLVDAPHELEARTSAYVSAVKENYMSDPNMAVLLSDLRR